MRALVTGASSGIGAAYARALHARGLHVVLHGRRRNELEALAADLGDRAEVAVADLADETALIALCEQVSRWEDLSWLVLNAGFGGHEYFGDQDLEVALAMIRVHDEATLRLTRAALPALRAHRGSLVLLSSIAGFAPFPGGIVYGASKAFLLHLAQGLHLEEPSLRVQALCPGQTRTEFHSRRGMDPDEVYKERGLFATQEPEEVVAASLRALQRGPVVCIPGANNKLMDLVARWAPRPILHGRLRAMAAKRRKERGHG